MIGLDQIARFGGLGFTDIFRWISSKLGGGDNQSPQQGESSYLDEQRALLVLVRVYQERIRQLSTDGKEAAGQFYLDLSTTLTVDGRPGAVTGLRKIIAFSSVTQTIKRPTGETGRDGKPVIEETKRDVPIDGEEIILMLYCMGQSLQPNGPKKEQIRAVIRALDKNESLKNLMDTLTVATETIQDLESGAHALVARFYLGPEAIKKVLEADKAQDLLASLAQEETPAARRRLREEYQRYILDSAKEVSRKKAEAKEEFLGHSTGLIRWVRTKIHATERKDLWLYFGLAFVFGALIYIVNS